MNDPIKILQRQRSVLVTEIACLQGQISALKSELKGIDEKILSLGKKTIRYDQLIDNLCCIHKRFWSKVEINKIANRLQISDSMLERYINRAIADGALIRLDDNNYWSRYRFTKSEEKAKGAFIEDMKNLNDWEEILHRGSVIHGLSYDAIERLYNENEINK